MKNGWIPVTGAIFMWLIALYAFLRMFGVIGIRQYSGDFLSMIVIAAIAVTIIGGIFAFKRRHWGMALLGSITSIFCSWIGILAIILIFVAKNQFDIDKSTGKTDGIK